MANVRKGILWRVAICFVAVFLFAIAVAHKMFTIQVVEGEKWLSRSDSTMIMRQGIAPTRGNIYSDNGALLATSMPSYEIRFDPTVVDADSFRLQVGELAMRMAELFPEYSASHYRQKLVNGRRSGSRYVLIHRRVNYNQWKAMQSWPIFRMGRYKGGMISILSTRRVRPAGQLALRTIGYRTKDNPGVGLERAYNDYLEGDTGVRLVQRISGGYRPLGLENLVEPQNGKDVHTTLNIEFQEVAHQALAHGLEKHKADHGSVVIMEVATGDIKAMVNLQYSEERGVVESYNYAVGESYEPGSVWKVFTAMAALEDGVIKPGDTMDLMNGLRMYSGRPMKDSDKKFKKVSFQTAFARSSNVAFSSVIYDNYRQRPGDYLAHLKRLGLHEKTGIEILGEPSPYLNQPGNSAWSKLSLPWLAIGYENQHTPLQILTAYNGVINGGKLVYPRLVNKITDAGLISYEPERKKPIQVCSKATSDLLLEFTRSTVEEGTGANIRSSIVSMGGKTGTAQIAGTGGYQQQRHYNASWVGHFPAEQPQYSVYVMVNQPSNGIFYASYVAAPIFKELAEKIYTISVEGTITPDSIPHPMPLVGYGEDLLALQSALAPSAMPDGAGKHVIIGRGGEIHAGQGQMPDVVGLGLRDAIYLLEQEGLQVRYKGNGMVLEQFPAAGTDLSKRTLAILQLGI